MAADKTELELSFQALCLDDIELVFAIESQVHSHPWSKNTISSCFGKNTHNIAAYYKKQLVAYCFCRMVAGEAELLNISVAQGFQSKGLGRQLMNYLFGCLKEQGAEALWLEVRESNARAQALYVQQGFKLVDKRRGYYPCKQGREDALIMSCYL